MFCVKLEVPMIGYIYTSFGMILSLQVLSYISIQKSKSPISKSDHITHTIGSFTLGVVVVVVMVVVVVYFLSSISMGKKHII